ncbi:cytochrome c oxidase assembly protein [Streptomyces yunnanensis]|uniref:cytochrome c oxidase assembly protein n=1 Tax=Streptomyces yunnanensis TaxID=156453 RepID=UPI001ABF3938|nr:cytochrome c oxidase assembly protein [Streptomyces yunnanensis]
MTVTTLASTTVASGLPELTAGRLIDSWRLDPYALVLILVLGGLYAWGVVRLARRGERWPVARTVAFAGLGLGAIALATMSGLAVYDHELFWPAAVQNIVLDLIAPLGLALGDPLSLALAALPQERPAARRLRAALSGRLLRFLTFPLVSTVLVLSSELAIYFTPYFPTALRHGPLHELMYLQLLVTGSLFVLPMLTRQELLPSWCSHPVRALLVLLDGLVDAVPGIVVMTSGTLIAGGWYASQHRPWDPSPQQDQMIGGGLMLTIAELVGLPFLIAVFAEWVRDERRRTRALDERLDRELAVAAAAPTPTTTTTSATTATTAATVTTTASSPGEAAVPQPELTRPWWETDQGEVGERFRRGR